MFFPPKAIQNSSLSLSFYNLNITGDYRHLSFPFYSNASLPRLIQVILYYSSIPHPGPSFPNPPELPTLIHFSQNRSCQTSSNESGQTSLCYSLTSGTGPAKLNLLPFVKVCLLYLNIPHRSWTRGHGPAKLNLLPSAWHDTQYNNRDIEYIDHNYSSDDSSLWGGLPDAPP